MEGKARSMGERACSRMRDVSQHLHRLTHCFREQARSHNSDRVGSVNRWSSGWHCHLPPRC
ncbi:hypothetical protein C7A12_07785 [Pseudomonas fluorescens]|nr:hypothetical protein C7A12_07785 [Pseudomonas fluorescens]PRW82297.1 hypothetical protein C7A13_03465 [Pseudomonas fluorescens]